MISTGSFGYVLLVTGALGILLVGFLLARKRPLSYYFFIISLLCTSYSGLLLAIVKTKWILLEFPHLFLTPQPFHYLIGPACYYFALVTINPYHRFKAVELLHLLPFLLHTIELLPFFTLDTEAKREIVTIAYRTGTSMTPPSEIFFLSYFQHLFLKSASIFVYSLVGLVLLGAHYRQVMSSYRETNMVVYQWVTVELSIKVLLGISMMIKAILSYDYPRVDLVMAISLAMDTLIGFGFIILNPRILEGARPVTYDHGPIIIPTHATEPAQQPEMVSVETEEDENQDVERPAPTDTLDFGRIESYFQTRKPFLNNEFSRDLLADRLRIPQRRISMVIKSSSGLNFSDYVNNYRLHYLEDHAASHPEWKKFTIDAIAEEIGFSNRITFYNACKRHRGMTPSELLKSMGLGERD